MSDKPIECSHCQREASITYKEIAGRHVTVTKMCTECPLFEKKLCGSKRIETKQSSCLTCQTTRDAVNRGEPLGCSNCYTLFEDLIYPALTLPISSDKQKITYDGQANLEPCTIDPTESRLALLNEALQDSIKQENYEQAASLRDQIQLLLKQKK